MNLKTRQKLQAMERSQLERLIVSLFDLLDGQEWSADTLDAIGLAFDRAGLKPRDYQS